MTTEARSHPLSLIVSDLEIRSALSRQEDFFSHGNHFWICPLHLLNALPGHGRTLWAWQNKWPILLIYPPNSVVCVRIFFFFLGEGKSHCSWKTRVLFSFFLPFSLSFMQLSSSPLILVYTYRFWVITALDRKQKTCLMDDGEGGMGLKFFTLFLGTFPLSTGL